MQQLVVVHSHLIILIFAFSFIIVERAALINCFFRMKLHCCFFSTRDISNLETVHCCISQYRMRYSVEDSTIKAQCICIHCITQLPAATSRQALKQVQGQTFDLEVTLKFTDIS